MADETILHITNDADWAAAQSDGELDVGDEFPHIYGPLNLDAVIGTQPLPEGPDGYAFSD